MPRTRGRAIGALVLALAFGVVGCGGDENRKASPEPAPSSAPSGTGTPTASPTSAGTLRPGLPSDLPAAFPVVAGTVTDRSSSGEEGRKGWSFHVTVRQAVAGCFEEAIVKLVEEGWTKQGETAAGGTRQAQLTKPGYAVIVEAEADGRDGCVLGYQVGQVGD
ncbi:hypothetical protein EFK50_19005 [Nocardioides marmoriginsengisoli]|uniref:Lipoprotein n=1 Tax=Nocardioides marmoriginsengisoli TaxID=661483 RepID=A0A3N0CBI7_9ACTN|nr:hypothetical protein [Nocardioides marmoriginsengisoli]RNL60426.1 hypothetical protein EFK50_19005 [Nocardioides marmoriginsengisoli]